MESIGGRGRARPPGHSATEETWRVELSSAAAARDAVAPAVVGGWVQGVLVPVRYQLVIDCADPDRLARFWAAALGYELAPPPAGFAAWNDYYRDLGIAEQELGDGVDRISDPDGQGPDIWFHAVSEAKIGKNRLHLDIHSSGDRRDPIEARKYRVDAEAGRLVDLGATTVGP